MDKFNKFISTSVLGGLVIILPAALTLVVITWIYSLVTKLLAPITNLIVARGDVKAFIANIIAIATIITVCFFVGVFVKTRFGQFFYNFIETKLLRIAPGYTIIKETVLQLLGNKKAPFSKVVLAKIFDNDTAVTGFLTDEHDNGYVTVFVPTGPNPTSGGVFHVKKENIQVINVPVEEAMRSIISCGAGSDKLMA